MDGKISRIGNINGKLNSTEPIVEIELDRDAAELSGDISDSNTHVSGSLSNDQSVSGSITYGVGNGGGGGDCDCEGLKKRVSKLESDAKNYVDGGHMDGENAVFTHDGNTLFTLAGLKGKDGKDGEDAISVRIDSTAGNFFVNGQDTTILTCSVFKGMEDITDTARAFTWSKRDKYGNIDPSWTRTIAGNRIVVYADDVLNKAVFECVVTL